MQQERYLAKRDLVHYIRKDVFTARRTLDARLENFWPTRAIDRANRSLTKVRLDDGTWKPMVLEMVPKAPKKSNRALGIYRPLSMCRVFTQRKHMKAELDN
eukprot:5347011-Pleurochrysis_carterae.AAC.1